MVHKTDLEGTGYLDETREGIGDKGNEAGVGE